MGSSVGVVLPLIMGVVGISSLFHRSLPVEALIDLIGIVSVLYPSYVFFAVSHHEFLKRRSALLLEKLPAKKRLRQRYGSARGSYADAALGSF